MLELCACPISPEVGMVERSSSKKTRPKGRETTKMGTSVRQAIVTKYHGPTERRDARISATSGSGHHRVYVEIPDDVHADHETAHRLAAIALCKKLGWPHLNIASGGLRNGYVFIPEADAVAVLRRLVLAASARENVMGDPCRLLECKDELQSAIQQALEVLS